MFGLYAMDGRPAVRRRRAARPGARRARQEDVASRSATSSTRWTGSTGTAPTRPRFTLARGRQPRRATCRSARSGCQGSRNFCNKLWNATRFALLNGAHRRRATCRRPPTCPVWTGGSSPGCSTSSPRSTRCSRSSSSPRSSTLLYHFAWDEVCDWYVELAKPVAAPAAAGRRRHPPGARRTSSTRCCGCCTRSIPFVTEALWTALTGRESVVIARLAGGRPRRYRGRRGRGARSPRCRGSSPRSAGSAPTRGCARRSGWPPGSTGLAGAGLAAHEPLIRSLVRLDRAGDGFAATATLAMAGGVTRRARHLAARSTWRPSGPGWTKDSRPRPRRSSRRRDAKLGNPAFLEKAPGRRWSRRSATGWPRPRPTSPGSPPRWRRCRSVTVSRTRFPAERRRPSWRRRAASPGWSSTSTGSRRCSTCSGSPQRAYPSIHLTGTNGKTSTARMIDSLLRAFGLRTGRYTSPHLETVRERISLDGEPVERGAVRRGLPRGRAAASTWSTSAAAEPLTYFEVITAMAFAAFADAPVDVAVVEVGLGGAEDATNVLQAGGRVITPIGAGPHRVARRHASRRSPRRRPASSTPARRSSPPPRRRRRPARSCERCAEVGATVAREGARVRRAAPGGRRRRSAAHPAGPGRRLRRDLPAAARRAPGAERGGGAGRRRGVPRCRRPTRQLDLETVREGFAGASSPGPAGAGPQRADRAARRRAQPARAWRPPSPRCRRSSRSAGWSRWSAVLADKDAEQPAGAARAGRSTRSW